MEQGQAVQLAPTDAELERAIASVPGVVTASIDRSADSGGSRMRLRLSPGEDEEAVAWAVAATLRERFGIALDPDAIRPRTGTPETGGPADTDRPHVTPASSAAAELARDPVRVVHEPSHPSSPPTDEDLADTRERLRLAAERALAILPPAESASVARDRTDEPSGGDTHADADGTADATDAATAAGDDAATAAGDEAVPAAVGDEDGAASDAPEVRAPTMIPRAAIVSLDVQRHVRMVEVGVTLEHAGRREQGRVVAVPTSHGTLRAVAEATVAALRALTKGSLLVGIERVNVKLGDDAPTATVILSLLTRRGEERLLGASIVRDGAERAVMRATLDALNRRVTPLLLEHTPEPAQAD